ncbi:putative PurR-regulated permease PerM [Flavobacterium sp. PL11]|uniref:AI-2E family transporter n=1 Tax=Flavobacterium sp. PL11 TaxID=3071717 RepID=UPI002E098A62|nr:putative PurR-regulated permease PerM [Flavobacterium sp. PL11]
MEKENQWPIKLENNLSFHSKVWITVGIVALSTIILLILKITFSVFLLILAGTLIAVFFRGISNFIHRKTKWKDGLCTGLSIFGTLLIVAGLFWLIGTRVESQFDELIETLPKTIDNVKNQLQDTTIGNKIINKISSNETVEKVQGFASQFFQSTFGVVGDIYVVLFIGIFFTISPKTYTDGIIALVPKKGQQQANQVLDKLGTQLLNWLKGKLFSMLVVFILTAIGLSIVGIPLWLVLALVAGLISFIPNFGPLIALIPALLIALLQGPGTAAIVAGMYILIQFIESNFITTLVQKKLLNMPPALIIIAQLLMGALTGGWGLVLATPITVIVIVLVQELYIKNRD